MKIECEICGAWADLDETPLNNICPVCLSVGSLFISDQNTRLKSEEDEKIIDCRKCGNCDMKNKCCKLYGNDPKIATSTCAQKNFGGYRPNHAAKTDKKGE